MAIIKKYQQGGPMPAEAAPAPEMGGQDQMMAQLEQMAMEIIQSIGPEGAAMLAEMIMQMLQSAQQPVGAPAEGQPVFRRGGKLARRVK
jgi:hypothetical protein